MSEGLNQQERYGYMAKVLKKHSYAIQYMSEENLRDYVELIHLFLKSENHISQMGNVSTMELIVKNTSKEEGFK
ncbi:hypothetical protein ACQKP0_00545 [Heyndrickxia sp. NPDC080065]|uniref:hypothetical protein n=1 Tax=Heyndrickxia sp. NPDC080065 TaxID=3390568 RepID=UPI003CFEA8A1